MAAGGTLSSVFIDFRNNNLTQASVDAILAACVGAGLENTIVNLFGVNNSAPGAQGLIDVATLEAAGCTVSTS
jgi:hypothetical protein